MNKLKKIFCFLLGHTYRGWYDGLWGIARGSSCRMCGKKYKEGDRFRHLYYVAKRIEKD